MIRSLTVAVLLTLASTAGSEPVRWAHDLYGDVGLVRAYDAVTGELVAEVTRDEVLEVPDRDMVTVSVVLADTGEESPRSGTRPEECASWDSNGDGFIGGPDWYRFWLDWQTDPSGSGFTAFASWWQGACP